MHPIHDVDVTLLLALSLASKRRSAELFEIMAAAELVHGTMPLEPKLAQAFARLATHGLIREAEGGYALTPEAEIIMAGGSRKADAAKRIMGIKEKLSAYTSQGEHASILVTVEQLSAAIKAYRASGAGAGRNLLVPKPKVEERKPRGRSLGHPFPGRH